MPCAVNKTHGNKNKNKKQGRYWFPPSLPRQKVPGAEKYSRKLVHAAVGSCPLLATFGTKLGVPPVGIHFLGSQVVNQNDFLLKKLGGRIENNTRMKTDGIIPILPGIMKPSGILSATFTQLGRYSLSQTCQPQPKRSSDADFRRGFGACDPSPMGHCHA